MLKDQYWSNCDLGGLNLSILKLSGAELLQQSIRIGHFYLSGANLSHATISNIVSHMLCKSLVQHDENNPSIVFGVTVYFDFTGANLSHADLDHSYFADLQTHLSFQRRSSNTCRPIWQGSNWHTNI